MADQNLMSLTDGGYIQSSDNVYVVRGGADRRVRVGTPPYTYAELLALPTAGLTANVSRAYVTSPEANRGDYLWNGTVWIPLTMVEVTPYVNLTATGTAFTGPCELAGYDCTVAAGNITIYDGTSTSGTVIVSSTALSVGRTEFAYKRYLTTGCHVVLSGAATVNVLVG